MEDEILSELRSIADSIERTNELLQYILNAIESIKR
jgi:hypothetical protein